jgi:hypothetical protein
MKFLVAEDLARLLEQWFDARLTRDPHGQPELGGAYQSTSLYTDTAAWDVYHRTTGYRRRKFRVRRYGETPHLFLERKSKNGDRVWKRRSSIDERSLLFLAEATSRGDWPGQWFHAELLSRRLQPACRITYRRRAWIGQTSDGSPIRVTIDRTIIGIPTTEWSVQPVHEGRPLYVGQAILEMKFRSAMPAIFKALVAEHRLVPSTASKYRQCCEVWGIPSSTRGVASA